MGKKWWIVIGVVVLIAALGFFGYQYLAPQQAAAEEPGETAVVRRGMLLVTVEGTGSLASHSEVSLSFSAGGQVDEVLVVEGQQVEAGQPLVRLDTDDLELQVTQAEISLQQAELQLEALQEPPDEAGIEIARAAVSDAAAACGAAKSNLTLTEHSVSVGDNVRAAASARDRAYSKYEDAMAHLGESNRMTEMAHSAYLDALGQYNRAVESAELQLTTAQNEVTRAYHSLQQAQDSLDKLLEGAGERDIEAAQLQVDQSSAALEQVRLRLEQATLTAPMAGDVTSLSLEPGEMVNPGQTVIVLSDLTALEVEVNLDETDVVQVAVGQEAQIALDAFPGVEIAGEVTYIAPTAQTQTGVVLYPVTIRLTPGDPSASSGQASGQGLPVRAGMTADVAITTASQEDVLIVPLRAVEAEVEERRAYVRRLVGDQVERVEVTLGMMTETEVEIAGDVAEGDVVLVAPSAQGSAGGGMFGMFGGGE